MTLKSKHETYHLLSSKTFKNKRIKEQNVLQVQSDQSEYRIIKLGKDNTIEHIQFPLLTKSHRTIGERAWEQIWPTVYCQTQTNVVQEAIVLFLQLFYMMKTFVIAICRTYEHILDAKTVAISLRRKSVSHSPGRKLEKPFLGNLIIPRRKT